MKERACTCGECSECLAIMRKEEEQMKELAGVE